MMNQNLYPKVGVVVALQEEFTILLNVLGINVNSLIPQPFKEYAIYEVNYETASSNSLDLVFLVLDDMSNRESALGTQYLLGKYELCCVVNIGISGLFSDDFHLCDVIIGSSSIEYDYRAKIVDDKKADGTNTFSFLHGGQTFKPSNNLYNKLSQIETVYPRFYKKWQKNSEKEIKNNIDPENLHKLHKLGLIAEKQIIQKGDLASGSAVISAVEFKKHLKTQNRNYSAIDMESAGFLSAIHKAENTPSLVIKGLSDPADERKKELDNIKSGIIRKIAMQNSVFVFKLFLDNYSFVNNKFSFIEITSDSDQKQLIENQEFCDSIYKTTIRDKIKAPFGSDAIFEKEIEWNKLFYLISDFSDIEVSEESFIQDITTFILNSQNQIPLKISGLPGSGISPFLSFLYRYLYRYFETKESNIYPIYLDFRHYRYKIYKDDSDILEQAQNYLKDDIEEIKENLASREIKNIVLIYDGVDYSSEFQRPLENIIIDVFKNFQAKKIIGIRNYKYIDRQNDTETESIKASINFSSVSIKDGKFKSLLDYFSNIFEKYNFKDTVTEILEASNFDFIDYFFLNLMNKRINNLKEKNLSCFFESYCKSFFITGNKYTGKKISLPDAAKLAYDYKINKKKFSENELYCNPAWQLMCRHSRIQDYLIAKYIVESLIDIANGADLNNFNFTFPYCINSFCKLLINNDIVTQNLILEGAKKVLSFAEDVSRHANAIYLIGRLTDDKIKNDAKKVINEYLKNHSPIDKLSIKEDNAQLLALRTSYISLAYLGDCNASKKYLEKLLSDEIWCSINRGFHLIYYGDKVYEPKFGLIAEDNNSDFPLTYKHLYARINDLDRNEIVEIEIYTLFSLINHRHKHDLLCDEKKRKEAIALINFVFKNKNIENHSLIFYLKILQNNLSKPVYSHFSMVSNLLKLKFEKRKGWYVRNFDNVETVASHVIGTLYIASFLLPDNSSDYPGYDKLKIIDMLLFHDLAESEIGDKLPEEKNDIIAEQERDFYSKLAAYSAYGYFNVLYVEKLWKEFESKSADNINALIAYEIDKLEAYAQLLSYLRSGESILKDDYDKWVKNVSIVKTTHGMDIKKWIEQEFADVIYNIINNEDENNKKC